MASSKGRAWPLVHAAVNSSFPSAPWAAATVRSCYERDKNLRIAAVEHHGVTCKVYGFNFEEIYGERGKDYIEVHHLRPVSTLGKGTKVDPKSDMTVLCSNCHRMIHRRKDNVLTPEELKSLLRK
jgi:5-methylcytosine-specific restriction enzyme A